MPAAPPPEGAVIAGPRMAGQVWWFCPDRGFGWVRDEGGRAWFTTYSELPGAGFRCLDDGLPVTFVPGRDHHGPVAREVTVVAHESRLAG